MACRGGEAVTIEEAKAKVVSVARAEVGYREGSNNYNKFADDPGIERLYGWKPQNQPWCCVFANWVYLTAFGFDIGSRLTYGGSAACAVSASYFREHGALVNQPQIGDQSFYYSGSGINHTGIVVDVSSNSFYAVEGNYSDKVSLVKHQISGRDIAGFGRPNWSIISEIEYYSSSEIPKNGENWKNNVQSEEHSLILPMLRTGSKGNAVALLQSLLTIRGFTCGKYDGEFGPLTQAAVNRFQKWANLAVDGVVGKDTWTALLKMGE